MDFETFKESLASERAPSTLSVYAKAMWYDGKEDWEKAHHLIQDLTDKTAAWIHAYLHRKEEDIANADYWYRRANRKRPDITLEKEWEEIVKEIL
jgi:hypothetical protein